MKTLKNNKKTWQKPVIQILNIKKDTFSGSLGNAENPQNPQPQKKR